MATQAQICNFIKLIAPDVQKAYATLGKVKPSVCIGMAIVESGAGTSRIMSAHNALWGQKVGTGKTATKYWEGKFFVARTKEEYKVGEHTVIRDAFRSYPSVLMGAFNYYELLNTSLYRKVKSDASFEEQMKQIKACGYMTSSSEVASVLSYINKYRLYEYDYAEPVAADRDNPYPIPTGVLKVGVRNAGVKWVQYELNSVYGYNIAVDGWYGSKTKAAIVDFQKRRGLVADGVVGPKTLKAMGV